MKKLLATSALFCTLASAATAHSGEKYIKAVEGTLVQLKDAQSAESLMSVANRFEMIGKNEPTEWLPNYYAAFTYILMSFKEKDNIKREKMIDKAESLIKTLPYNDEVCVLKAFSANAFMAIDPAARYMTYGAKFEEFLNEAAQLNAANPRVDYLRAVAKYHTPEQYGGGLKVACPMLQKTKEKYDAFQAASTIHPKWGWEQVNELLKNCQ